MRIYRLVLYKKIDVHWNYVRILLGSDGQLHTEQGLCGYSPSQVEKLQLNAGADPEAMVRRAGELWAMQGYGPVSKLNLPVLTLHFKMPKWRGLLPAAPWFDDWMRYYLEPIRESFEGNANGILKNEERFSGHYLFYYTVFNPDLARQAVAVAAAASPTQFDLEISISTDGKTVAIPIDPEVPQFLQEFLRGLESTARVISNGLSTVPSMDPLKPELVQKHSGQRLRSEEAQAIYARLKQEWRFEYAIWDPNQGKMPLETVFFSDLQDTAAQKALLANMGKDGTKEVYFLDFENGIYRLPIHNLFHDVWEGLVFDTQFNWFLYSTDFLTLQFGKAAVNLEMV